jgi:hypothetical protein
MSDISGCPGINAKISEGCHNSSFRGYDSYFGIIRNIFNQRGFNEAWVERQNIDALALVLFMQALGEGPDVSFAAIVVLSEWALQNSSDTRNYNDGTLLVMSGFDQR